MGPKKPVFRIYFMLAVIFVVVMGAVIHIVQSNTNGIVSELTFNQAQTANHALVRYLEELQSSALERAEMLAGSEFIVTGIKDRDYGTLQNILTYFGEGVDSAGVCDADGVVLIRRHNDQSGDDISRYAAVSKTLKTGFSSSSIEKTTNFSLSAFASAPVYDGDTLIGAVCCNFDLTKNEYMDEFKDRYGCEAMIVYGDERINTTLVDENGSRIIGSKADERVIESVIGKQTDYSGRLEMFGKKYQVYYSPLIVDSQAVGMLFTGVDIGPAMDHQRDMNRLIILVSMIAIGVAVILIVVLNRSTRMFADTLKELSDKTASLDILERVLNAMDIFIHVTDSETEKMLFANKKFKEHFSVGDSVIGEYCWKVFREGRCDSCPRPLLMANPGEPVTWEEYKDVTCRYYRTTVRIIDWPGGKKVVFHYRVDISETKQAQETLLRMSSIVQNSPDFISYETLNRECLYVNPAAADLTGYSREELMKDYASLLFDEETAALRREIPRIVMGKGIFAYEVTAIRKDGERRIFSVRTFLIESNEGAFGSIATDVTERKRVEAERAEALALAENRDKLLQTVNNAASILLQPEVNEFENSLWKCMGMIAESVDADRVYMWKNHMVDGQLYCKQIYEWSEGAEPQQGNEYTIDIPYSENAPEWNERLPSGQCINGLVREMSPNVRNFLSAQGILSILVVPVFLRGQFWGFVGFDDCHRERVFSKDEEAILCSVSLLFTNALLRNEMTLGMDAALKEAQSANRAKSDFLSRMSHEMRTPMNAIIGLVSLAQKTEISSEKQECLKKISVSADHLLGIINDILDMSKIEAGKMELLETDFRLGDMLGQVAAVMDVKLNEKRQNFTVCVDENVPRSIIADKQRLAQVITNLISNANKFTPEGGNIALTIHKAESGGDSCKLLISVRDDGAGISEDDQERLFHAFEQADNTITRGYGGTGLGLSISKNLVRMMNGDMWVESKPGGGSVFNFTVTVGVGAADENNDQDENNPETGDVLNIFAGKHILLADDVEINREILVALLEETGVAIDCVENGKEACDTFAGNPGMYDLIFMDIHMPEMDGHEAAKKIREMKIPEARTVPIIAVTADVFSEDIEKSLAAGMNDHVGKPLDMDTVIAKMKLYLHIRE